MRSVEQLCVSVVCDKNIIRFGARACRNRIQCLATMISCETTQKLLPTTHSELCFSDTKLLTTHREKITKDTQTYDTSNVVRKEAIMIDNKLQCSTMRLSLLLSHFLACVSNPELLGQTKSQMHLSSAFGFSKIAQDRMCCDCECSIARIALCAA